MPLTGLFRFLNISKDRENRMNWKHCCLGVRMFAAYGLLSTSPKIAVPVLKEISQREDIHSLTAKMTLEQWEQNTLMYPF